MAARVAVVPAAPIAAALFIIAMGIAACVTMCAAVIAWAPDPTLDSGFSDDADGADDATTTAATI